ncbi:MAG: HAMP domain-containing histidine kinase, partial [Acetobacteraceae bacterium]|nr:HAMP domain-containing histidine kinase [Acetobacteraceae bacterium]
LAPRLPAALLDGGGEDARLVEVTRPLATLLGASGLALRGKPWEEAAPLLGLAPVRDAQADGDLSGGVLHSACSPEYGPLFLRLERRPALQIEAPDAALHLDLVLANDGTREGRLAEALGAAGHQMGQVRRSRDAFLRTTSHELRAPLAGIIGLARMLQEPGVAASAEEVRQHAAEIARAGEDMLALVENLLAVALVEAERLVPRREEVDLAGLLRRQAQLLAPLFAGRMVHLSLSLPDAAKGATDARLVGSAVLNLLSNALKFTPPGGEVGCALSIAAGVAEIRVTDTGPGIRAGDRARVFAAFEQAGSSAGGAGLGLFIARNMAEALGGSLSLDPARTRGAGFVLRIPVYDEPGEGPELR